MPRRLCSEHACVGPLFPASPEGGIGDRPVHQHSASTHEHPVTRRTSMARKQMRSETRHPRFATGSSQGAPTGLGLRGVVEVSGKRSIATSANFPSQYRVVRMQEVSVEFGSGVIEPRDAALHISRC